VSPDWNGVLLSDIRMPGMDGWQLFRRARAQDPELPVILMTGHGDIPQAVEAVQAGAFDFLAKPFAVERLLERLDRALAHRRLVLENRSLRAALDAQASGPLIGRSAAIRSLRVAIAELAGTDLNLVIQGETGTGKDMVARMLHEASPRRRRRFVVLDCGGLPASAPEGELFGHVPGSFPGAARRVGRLELADGGTLYLDAIENLPPPLQSFLLRSLDAGEVTPLGSNQPRAVDLRVVASTTVGLDRLMADGRLRPELAYRLAGPQLTLPPLRDRREDIPMLFEHFRQAAARRLGLEAAPAAPGLLDGLMTRSWPGNVRELKSAADQSLISSGEVTAALVGRGLAEQVAAFEAELIRQALAAAGQNARQAAGALELPLRTFYDKLARHGIAKP
jgi:two-component system C4-dicarboxylate transport response regulator DctD